MRSLQNVALGMILAVAAVPLFAGETVSNQPLGFRLSVPDGFVQDPTKARGDILFAFMRPAAPGDKANSGIMVSRMRGVMGREKIDPKLIATKAPKITVVTEKWKDFEIEVTRVPEEFGPVKVVTFNAQVPLKPEAIQISVVGETARENELRSALRTVLATLDGQTNWLTTDERINRGTIGIAKMAITIAVLLFLGGLVWRALRGRKSTGTTGAPGDAAEPSPE
jgi:hypothetical protein